MENLNLENKQDQYSDKVIKPKSGFLILFLFILFYIAAIGVIIYGHIANNEYIFLPGYICIIIPLLFIKGFKLLGPNDAVVLVLFGKYYGTIKQEGFFFVNPFTTTYNPTTGLGGKTLSTKAMTLNNEKQKVNDLDGNPIEIGVVVIWKIEDAAMAVFNVNNYKAYISTQADAAIRNIARQYPYDLPENDQDEKSLRGSSQEIANVLCSDLQKRVAIAGIKIIEARISHLAYSSEIAAAMLQRQQAKAIVDARTKIVEGAVGMVELALEKLDKNGSIKLDNEKKAMMVTNLMVVLCSNKDAQPIVNSGSKTEN